MAGFEAAVMELRVYISELHVQVHAMANQLLQAGTQDSALFSLVFSTLSEYIDFEHDLVRLATLLETGADWRGLAKYQDSQLTLCVLRPTSPRTSKPRCSTWL